MDEGSIIETDTGHELLLLRPLLADYVLSMPRGAQVVYPKDSGQVIRRRLRRTDHEPALRHRRGRPPAVHRAP